MKYKIVLSEIYEDVEDEVNQLLSEGWEFKPNSDIIIKEIETSPMFLVQMIKRESTDVYREGTTPMNISY